MISSSILLFLRFPMSISLWKGTRKEQMIKEHTLLLLLVETACKGIPRKGTILSCAITLTGKAEPDRWGWDWEVTFMDQWVCWCRPHRRSTRKMWPEAVRIFMWCIGLDSRVDDPAVTGTTVTIFVDELDFQWVGVDWGEEASHTHSRTRWVMMAQSRCAYPW